MFVRLSLSTPAADHHDEILKIENDLLAFFATQPGYVDGYGLATADQVGRLTVWESEAAADHVANAQHTLALRSELLRMTEGEPLEMHLDGTQVKKA